MKNLKRWSQELDACGLGQRLAKLVSSCAFGFAVSLGLSGCHAGGNITASIASVAPVPVVASPTVAAPGLSPYYSNSGSITITGVCNNASQIVIAGDQIAQTTCTNSAYSFTVTKANDGVYSFFLTQSGPSGTSSPTLFVWIKKSTVAVPQIIAPALNPYLSGEAVLTISGACENNATVTLSGDGTGSTVCTASMFALTLPKAIDGDYNLVVTQTDQAGNSASTPLVWKKHALTVSPTGVSFPSGTDQQLTITGGSGSYNVVISTNNSGGSYNSTTKVYTTGHISGVTDTLTVTDTANSTTTAQFSIVAGAPDHLVYATVSGDAQNGVAGQLLTVPLKARLVDRFGNGLPSYKLAFQMTLGDASFIGSPIQTTDSQGYVSINVRLGFHAPYIGIQLKPVSTILPDAAGTGNTTLNFAETAQASGAGNFGTLFNVGTNPASVVTGDFDGDGIVDVVVLHSGEKTIGFLKGRGDGTYASISKTIGACNGTQMASGDFNGDGKIDIAATCSADNLIEIFLGNGDGTFQTPSTIAVGQYETNPAGIAVGNFDGDTKQDIIIASTTGRVIAYRKGNGNGTFQAPLEYQVDVNSSQATIRALAVGDLKHRGVLDVVVAMSDGNNNFVSVLSNSGAGAFNSFQHYQVGSNPSSIAIGNLDVDPAGFPAIVVTNAGDNSLSLLHNDETGKFDDGTTDTISLSGDLTPVGVTIADFGQTGRLSIGVVSNDSSTLTLLLKQAGNSGYLFKSYATGSSPVAIVSGDVNADGIPDIVIAASGTNQVQVLPVQAGAVINYSTTVGQNPVVSTSAIFTSSGQYDVAVVNQNDKTVTILKGNGKGFFTPDSTLLTTAGNPVDILSADFDQDGNQDLVVVNNGANSIRFYPGLGTGKFGNSTDFPVAQGPVAAIARDFDGDGLLDLAVVDQTASKVSILLGVVNPDGTHTFASAVNYNTGGGATSIASADLNGDHFPDLVIVNNSSNNVSVLLGNGDGTFQAQQTYMTGANPAGVVLGDFNNDGKIDVATVATSDKTVNILLGVGDGSLQTYSAYSCGDIPSSLVAGDFNGDNKLDLAVANSSSYGFTVLNGESNGQFNVSNFHATNTNVNSLQVSDVNSDGKLDLLVIDSLNSAIQVWMGH